MPKLVSELAQGKTYARSSDGGGLADTATRVWRILLNSPNEAFIVPTAIGVNIGDALSELEPIPCVSIDVKADGESRLVRIVTATYRTSPGVGAGGTGGGGGDGGQRDPKLDPPQVRPALFSISGGLEEIAVHEYYDTDGNNTSKKGATNPNGDMYDGLSTLVPMFTINIEQFDTLPTRHIEKIGHINSQGFTFCGSAIKTRSCMLKNIECVPVVETWGIVTFRGFKRTYQFSITGRPAGWDLRFLRTGFRVYQAGLGLDQVDSDALALERRDGRVLVNLPTPTGKDYAGNTQNTVVRAMVKVPFDDGGFTQIPSAQPVALDSSGRPASVPFYNGPNNGLYSISDLMVRMRTQPESEFGNDFSEFGIRWNF
jgi:hypothetical protein